MSIIIEPTRTTRRDPDHAHTTAAITALIARKHLQAAYGAAINTAIAVYGDAAPDYPWLAHAGDGSVIRPGSRALIAGVYRAHWPHAVKAQLRSICTEIDAVTAASMAEWRAAGRTLATWRRYAHANGAI